mgnify:CR=1 FL=1
MDDKIKNRAPQFYKVVEIDEYSTNQESCDEFEFVQEEQPWNIKILSDLQDED